jgi:large repetitive protein
VVYRLNLGLPNPKPQITIFSPTSAAVGTQVLLIGNYFIGASPALHGNGVSFNGVPATFMQRSNGYIVAKVPAGATSGPITVTTPNGTVTSTVSFTVQ